jgi:hypothetical protein
MTNSQQDTTRDRKMILSPDKWPMFYLPLKRRKKDGGFPEIALLRSASTRPDVERIVQVNMTLFGMAIGEVTEIRYPTVDDLLADGWVVD